MGFFDWLFGSGSSCHTGGGGIAAAPELDPSSAVTAIVLVLAAVMYLQRSYKRSS